VEINSAIVVAFAVADATDALLVVTSTDRTELGAISTREIRVM